MTCSPAAAAVESWGIAMAWLRLKTGLTGRMLQLWHSSGYDSQLLASGPDRSHSDCFSASQLYCFAALRLYCTLQAIGGTDPFIHIISIAEAAVVGQLPLPADAAVAELSSAADCPGLLLVLCRDGMLQLWQISSGVCLWSCKTDTFCAVSTGNGFGGSVLGAGALCETRCEMLCRVHVVAVLRQQKCCVCDCTWRLFPE
jgi:hypothetical protein